MSCLKMKKTRLREAGDYKSKLYLSTLARKGTEKRFPCGKLSSYKKWSTDVRLMKACPNLMHQGRWKEELENISNEKNKKKITSISHFVPPWFLYVNGCVFTTVMHKMIMNVLLGSQKHLAKDFLVWRTFPISFLDALFVSHLPTTTFTKPALLNLLWHAIQFNENFLNTALKVILGKTRMLL